MLKKILFLGIALLLMSNVKGQMEQINSAYQQFKEIERRNWDDSQVYYKGSPYLFDDFRNGLIIIKAPIQIETNIPVRFNVYEDELEYVEKKRTLVLRKDTSIIESFTIEDRRFILVPVESRKGSISFVEIIYEGEVSLYQRHIVNYFPAVKVKGYQNAAPPTFKDDNSIYYLKQQGKYIKVKNMKDIAKKMANKTGELYAFIKQNKLKMKRQEDIIRFMAYINEPVTN